MSKNSENSMIPFSTTILICGDYAEYEVSAADDDQYKAMLTFYPGDNSFAPTEIYFHKEGTVWVTKNPFYSDIAALLGIAIDIYLHKSSPFEYFKD